MHAIIDLSQEMFTGMPVHRLLPEVKISMHSSHEEGENIPDAPTVSPCVNKLEYGEHTGTHVNALKHMSRQNRGQSIDTMPLSMFFTEGICLNFSHKGFRELIEPSEMAAACDKEGLEIKEGDTVLLYTDHSRKAFGGENWGNGPELSADAARWLGNKGIAAFGVETMAPGLSGISNKEVHKVCGEHGFTHYENLINLHLLVGRGRFRFIGLPLRISGGTGSPVRAIAVFEK